jgi:hypothetical protein
MIGLTDNRGAEEARKRAEEAQVRAASAAEAARVTAQNMQSNFATNLASENIGQVVAGGTADAASASDLLKKKKSTTAGLAGQLGINV